MANKPSQDCRCCDGQGFLYQKRDWRTQACQACRGRGKVTIRVARSIGWKPIVHRKRVPQPQTVEMFA